MAANEILCISSLLRGVLCLRLLSLPGGQNPHCFSQPDFTWVPLPGSGALGWGAGFGVETPHSSEGNFGAEISLSYLLWEWDQAFFFAFLPALPVLMWLLL